MPALELTILALWSFAVAVAGGAAGLVLGNLRLPAVVAFAASPAAAAGANVTISGIAAITSAIAHGWAGRINWRLLGWLGPSSVAGGLAGGLLAGVVPARLLLALIALVVFYGAFEVRRSRSRAAIDRQRSVGRAMANAALIGFGVGVLGGLVGLILGTLRMPALMRWVGVGPRETIGTNSAAGVLVAVGGLAGHLPTGMAWDLVLVGGAASIPGAVIGARMVGRLDEQELLRAVAAILAVAGVGMLVAAIVNG